MSIREAAVAGMFYPGNPALLQLHLDELFDALEPEPDLHPQALVVPHIGSDERAKIRDMVKNN